MEDVHQQCIYRRILYAGVDVCAMKSLYLALYEVLKKKIYYEMFECKKKKNDQIVSRDASKLNSHPYKIYSIIPTAV